MLNVLVLPGARATSWRALWPRMGVLEAWAVHQVGPLGAALAGQLGATSPAVVVTRMDSSWAYLMCGWVRLLLRAGLGSGGWMCAPFMARAAAASMGSTSGRMVCSGMTRLSRGRSAM